MAGHLPDPMGVAPETRLTKPGLSTSLRRLFAFLEVKPPNGDVSPIVTGNYNSAVVRRAKAEPFCSPSRSISNVSRERRFRYAPTRFAFSATSRSLKQRFPNERAVRRRPQALAGSTSRPLSLKETLPAAAASSCACPKPASRRRKSTTASRAILRKSGRDAFAPLREKFADR
jgi:hypothetical protein